MILVIKMTAADNSLDIRDSRSSREADEDAARIIGVAATF